MNLLLAWKNTMGSRKGDRAENFGSKTPDRFDDGGNWPKPKKTKKKDRRKSLREAINSSVEDATEAEVLETEPMDWGW